MDRGRRRGAWLRAGGAGGTRVTIDLGIALSVYGKDADGRFVEIRAPGPAATCQDLVGDDAWPTEQ